MSELSVWSGRLRVGRLRMSGSGLAFAYDAGWLVDAAAFSVSTRLPRRVEAYEGSDLSSWLLNLLPEGEAAATISRATGSISRRSTISSPRIPTRPSRATSRWGSQASIAAITSRGATGRDWHAMPACRREASSSSFARLLSESWLRSRPCWTATWRTQRRRIPCCRRSPRASASGPRVSSIASTRWNSGRPSHAGWRAKCASISSVALAAA